MSCCERVLIAGLMAMMLAVMPVGGGARAQDKTLAPSASPTQAQVEVNLSGKTVTKTTPLTVRIRPTADLMAAFARAGDGETSIRLSVQTLAPKPGEWTGLHIFLNAPEERAKMTPESPHYIGSVAFYGDDEGEAVTFALDLGQTIQRLKQERLWRPNKPLMVTVVGVSGNTLSTRETLGIVIKQIVVSAPTRQVRESETGSPHPDAPAEKPSFVQIQLLGKILVNFKLGETDLASERRELATPFCKIGLCAVRVTSHQHMQHDMNGRHPSFLGLIHQIHEFLFEVRIHLFTSFR